MKMKDILKLVFLDSQTSKNAVDDDLSDLFEDAEDQERLEIKSKPLHAALKEIGVDRPLVSTPNGLHMEFEDADEYEEIRGKLLDINAIHPLAQAGWVATSSDDQHFTDELPKYVINFIELTTADIGKGDDSAEDLESIIKKAQELGDAHEAGNEPGGGVKNESAEHVSREADALLVRLFESDDDLAEIEPHVMREGPPEYAWIITADFLADDEERQHEHLGPKRANPEYIKRLQGGGGIQFKMQDDQDTVLFKGAYLGPHDETMRMPLGDWGEPHGATRIWYDGYGYL